MTNGRIRVRLRTNWTGTIEGEKVYVKSGDTADVPPDYAQQMVQRDIAELVSVEEILKEPKPKTAKRKATQKGKAFAGPVKDKMVAEAVANK